MTFFFVVLLRIFILFVVENLKISAYTASNKLYLIKKAGYAWSIFSLLSWDQLQLSSVSIF